MDLSASGHFGTAGQTKRELAAEIAGTLAMSAIRNNDRVGLILFTGEVEHYLPPRKTRQHVLRLLRDLLTHEPKAEGTSIGKALAFAGRVTHRPALLFLISDFHDQGFESALKATNQCHDLLTLHLIDPREQTLPDVGLAVVRDAETGMVLEVDTGDPLVRAAYEQSTRARQTELREMFQRASVGHLEVYTDRPWANSLRGFLTRVARRRVA